MGNPEEKQAQLDGSRQICSGVTGWAAARIYCEITERGESFAEFSGHPRTERRSRTPVRQWIAKSPLAETISKEMKRHGFKFVGPTIVYAWMQAVGIVSDHAVGCFRRSTT